ncbi:MAG TPA: pallilysin-related adhesin [Rectinemataceae bacterium]|nr:pallilysin-related adhesin [Rectinemataceae bacterium]
MKKLANLVFLVVCVLLVVFVSWFWWKSAAERNDASRPVVTRKLVVADSESSNATGPSTPAQAPVANRIDALPDEVVLDVQSLNLDNDEGEEQIITVRKTANGGNSLAIVVADTIPGRRGWFRSWESPIPVTKLTTLQVQTSDIVGDHWLSIVVTGMNEKNEQTLSIFREVKGSEKTGLIYAQIASVVGDSVHIENADRPESYQLGQTEGEPSTILSFSKDMKSSNPLDQVRTTWSWDRKAKAFAISAQDAIPGAQVERDIATKVLTGKESDFEAFLQGVWYDANLGPHDPKTRLLVFDRAGNSIVFYSGDSQEVFHWNESHATRTGLYVGAQNESVPTLRRLMDIEMAGADTVTVRVFEDLLMKIDSENRWDGSYRRFKDDGIPQATGGGALPLEGLWTADSLRLVFGQGSYSLTREGTSSEGRWIQYTIGSDHVVELIENGPKGKRRNYRIDLQNGAGGTRDLTLTPVIPTINGLERAEAGAIRASQNQRR